MDLPPEEEATLIACQELARTVRKCSQSIIEGTWVDESTVRGRTPVFIPKDFESAKAFLRSSVNGINRSFNRRSQSDTPVTSRPKTAPRMGVCHQCHGPIGSGAHQGSALGKGVCTFGHSSLCRGGIPENESWAPCPDGYIFDPNLVLAARTGFESTLGESQFQPAPASSTPVCSSGDLPPTVPVITVSGPTSQTAVQSQGNVSLHNGGMNLERRRLVYQVTDHAPNLPGMVDGAVGGLLNVPENIQNEIDTHRAANQNAAGARTGPGNDLDITRLRADPQLRQGVEDLMTRVIDPNIPSLSSAGNARVYDQYNGGARPRVSLTSQEHFPPTQQPAGQQGQVGQGVHAGQQPIVGGNPSPGSAILQDRGQYRGQVRQVGPPVQAQHQQHIPGVLPVSQPPPNNPAIVHQQTNHCGLGSPAQPQLHLQGHGLHSQHQPGLGGNRISVMQGGQSRSHACPSNIQSVQAPPSILPSRQYVGGQVARQDQYCYEYATDFSGRQVLVRVAAPTPQVTGRMSPPQQSYRWEYRCSPRSGRQWKVQVPIPPSPSAAPPRASGSHYEWRIHPHTGESYQVLVSTSGQGCVSQQVPAVPPPQYEWRIHPHTGESYQVEVNNSTPYNSAKPAFNPSHLQPVQSLGEPQHPLTGHQSHLHGSSPVGALPLLDNSSQQQVPPHLEHSRVSEMTRNERVAGIVSLLEGGGSTKGAPKVIEFARKCPTKWAKQATLSNINLPLYAWGVIEEVESALSGRSQAIPEPVILGKLRHLKNTLEICCQNSTSSEFVGFGWTLAKDYSTKLVAEIDQGRATWQDMGLEVKTSTLMSATMENPRPVQKIEKKKVDYKLDKRELCTTYNKCTTENKCDYEVQNPGKTCQRRHECSWCRLKKNQSWKHQESRCRNKESSTGA